MALNNNLIRLPVLTMGENRNINQNLNARATPLLETLTPEMQVQIYNMIDSAINSSRNSYTQVEVDETIREDYMGNIQDIDKVPDVVRYLKEFSGDASEFSSWKKSIERILQIYETKKGTPKYFGILNVIRNKIVGNADIVLESYNTPLSWPAISKCLTLHYADKRDISTLEYQLMSIVQANNSIEEFYKKVYSHLSLILNKISCMEIDNDSISLLTNTYRGKALDTFIRGLNGDLPRLLAIREPADMPQALHLCLKLQNMNYRNTFVKNEIKHTPNTAPLPRKVVNMIPQQHQQQYEQQQYQQQQSQYNQQHQQFYPQLAYLPRTQQWYQPNNHQQRFNNGNFQQPPPPRPIAPKPHEPMDVDQSIQTQRVNYMNRPQYESYGKRPASGNIDLQKRQRNFNIYSELQPCEDINKEENIPMEPQTGIQNLELPTQDFTDVHFLD